MEILRLSSLMNFLEQTESLIDLNAHQFDSFIHIHFNERAESLIDSGALKFDSLIKTSEKRDSTLGVRVRAME